ncbi:MAG: hypothetical protein KatS3mg043_1230 [Rhodothermaceae bacterium]|nr:MAG: hypothetical protein KatS3mg043_1230 [Rhodothermaceae bacterium]
MIVDRYRKLLRWQWRHNTIATDLVRIFLGVALLVRGVLFLLDPVRLSVLVEEPGLGWFVHYVTWAHIFGGALLAAGLFTRIAALIQLPILVGAVALVHLREGLLSPTQSLELATLVLFLLCVLLVFGPGRFSLDYYFWGRNIEPGPPVEKGGSPAPAVG